MSVTPKSYRRERGRYVNVIPGPTVASYRPPPRGVEYDAKRWPVWLGTRRDALEGWGARRISGPLRPKSFVRWARVSRLRRAYGRRK